MRASPGSATPDRRTTKGGGNTATKAEIIQFADLVQKHMDTDEIKELVRRTPGIEPEERKIVFLRLTSYKYDADIAAAEGVHYSRTSVARHLKEAMPKVINRYELDQLKAGA